MTRTFLAVIFWIFASVSALAQEAWFEVEALNPGLGEVADDIDRSTPQSTLEALLFLARNGRFIDAANLLDLSGMETELQRDRGPVLARKLATVIDRKVVIDWGDIVDRPDALDANAPSENAVAGQARRSIRLWLLDLDGREVEIRLNRLKAAQSDAVWLFSRQTVANIEALYAVYGPTALELALPDGLREKAFWGMQWWEVLGLPLAIAVAVLAGWLVFRTLSFAAGHANRKIYRDVLNAMRAPLIVAVITSVMAWATRELFVFSGLIDTVLSPLIVLGFVWAALHMVINVIDAILDRLVRLDDMDLAEIGHDKNRRLATRVSAGRRALIVAIVLVGGGMVLSSAKVFDNLGFSILASAGALTLILGFAARNVLGNIMASMQIAMNQSARIGDKILFKDHLCHVERIHFTYVQLRDWTGTRLVVPVEEFVSESFENWSMQEPELTRLIILKLDHRADVRELRDAFEEIVGEVDQKELGSSDGRIVRVTDHDVFGQEVTFCLPCANPNTAWDVSCEVREKLIRRAQELQANGAAMFPDAEPAEAV